MAGSPFELLKRNTPILGVPARTLIIGGAVVGAAVYGVTRNRAPRSVMPAVSTAATGDAGTGAAPTPGPNVADLIAQGASIAIQGAGLGLPLAGQALDLAGGVAGGAVSLAQSLAASQASAAASLASSLQTSLGLLPSFAPTGGVSPQSTAPPPPAPNPPGAILPDTFLGYEVGISGAGQVTGYVVGANCALSPRTMTFSKATMAPVTRGVCNGRVFWRTSSGGYNGISYVDGLSTGPWYIRRRYRRPNGTEYTVTIASSAS